jgi:putative transposase
MKLHHRRFPVGKMSQVFGVSESGYYRFHSAEPSARTIENLNLQQSIKRIFEKSRETYGSPRIHAELQQAGSSVSRPRVARIMSANGLYARKTKKFKVTTDSKHKYPIAPNVLNRMFTTVRSNEVWVSDITYINTTSGWLYLTVIIDLFDRKVIGWSMSRDMTAENTVIRAWRMAVVNRPISEKLIFHSDRGVQYACEKFTSILNSYSGVVTQSMSRKGNCWDNAVAESFFKTLKTECVYKEKYLSTSEAEISIFDWLETWYNRERRHSHLGNKSIEEFNISNHKFYQAA